MYVREINGAIKELAKLYPVLGITGPRQSGKTTIARSLFPNIPYVSLENLDTRYQALNDPRGFLKLYENGAIFDEVQNAPILLSYLQGIVDENPVKGKYIITGSQNFALSEQVAQSLSGRIGMLTLLPLSLSEVNSSEDVFFKIFTGGYPALHKEQIPPINFYPSYIQTYIERDVRQLKNIGNLENFQTFLRLCAARVGQLINFSSLAQDAGISHVTAKQWLSILKASYIVFTLQPYYQNFNKRLIKMPKLFFYDTGLACSLLGLEKEEQVQNHYLKGALFENLIALEILKKRFNKAQPANLYFWRDKTGHEIDLIAEWAGNIKALEVKLNATFQPSFCKNIHYFINLCREKSIDAQGYIIYNGSEFGLYKEIEILPTNNIEKIF